MRITTYISMLLALLGRVSTAQSLSIIRPTPAEIISSTAPYKITVNATAGAPAIYRNDCYLNNHYVDSSFTPPWTVTMLPGWYGDGLSQLWCQTLDVFGNLVAKSATVNFRIRTIGFSASILMPTMSMSISRAEGNTAAGLLLSFAPANGSSIAFSSAADLGRGSGTSLTASYTVGSGANRLLVVSILGDPSVDINPSVTYAGSPMIPAPDKQGPASGGKYLYFFYLLNPASGANTVAISWTGSTTVQAVAADYSGVAQTGQPDQDVYGNPSWTRNTGATASLTVYHQTQAANAWGILAGLGAAAGTGATLRASDVIAGQYSLGLFDTNGGISATPLAVSGTSAQIQSLISGTLSIDGRTAGSGDDWLPSSSGWPFVNAPYRGGQYTVKSTEFPNGLREVRVTGTQNQSGVTPFSANNTFSPSQASGTSVALLQTGSGASLNSQLRGHILISNAPVAFSTTGTAPTCSNCTGGSLQSGTVCYWSGSGQPCTFTAVASSGITTFTTNLSLNLTAGGRVDVSWATMGGQLYAYGGSAPHTSGAITTGVTGTAGQTCLVTLAAPSYAVLLLPLTGTNTIAQNTTATILSSGAGGSAASYAGTLSNGSATCSGTATIATDFLPTGTFATALNGLHTILASPAPTATTFAIATPGLPNGTYTSNAIVTTNVYYAGYVNDTTVALAESPGGTAINFTGGGTGTHTVSYSLINPFWASNSGQPASLWGPTSVGFAMMDFENGSADMEIRPAYSELYLCVTATSGCPSSAALGPRIFHSDLTSATPAATSFQYAAASDGGNPNTVVTVDSSGNVTATNPGWARITVACAAGTCDAAGLPSVTVTARVFASTPTFPTFTTCGLVGNSYIPPSQSCHSLIPVDMWHMQVGSAIQGGHNQCDSCDLAQTYIPQVMQEAAINATFEGYATGISDPSVSTCNAATNGALASWTTTDSLAATIPSYYEADFEDLSTPANVYIAGWAALLNNDVFDRQTCLKNYLASRMTAGRTFSIAPYQDEYTNNVGGGKDPIHNGLVGATPYAAQGFGAYLQSVVSDGSACTIHGNFTYTANPWNQSTGDGDGVTLSGSVVTGMNGFHLITATGSSTLSFPCAVVAGTYNSSNDPGLTMSYLSLIAPLRHHANFPAYNGSAVVTSLSLGSALTQITTSSGTATATFASPHQIPEGRLIWIQHATDQNLNTIAPIHVVDSTHISWTTLASAGPYTSSNESTLQMSLDYWNNPTDANNAYKNYMALFQASGTQGGPCPSNTILGISWGNPQAVYQWEGDPLMAASSSGGPCPMQYNLGGKQNGGTTWDNYQEEINTALTTRAYQGEPRRMLNAIGGGYINTAGIQEWTPDFNTGQEILYDAPGLRPESALTAWWFPFSKGNSGMRMYNWLDNTGDQYRYPGGAGRGADAARHNIFPRPFTAFALSLRLMQQITPYFLQPRINTPYYGPCFSVTAHQNPANTMRLLMIVSLCENAYQQTIDLSQFQYAGGTAQRYSLTAYRLLPTVLAGNLASDTYNFGAAGTGEVVVYLFQAPGVAPNLGNIAFGAPVPLPYGAAKMAVRVGYYPRFLSQLNMPDAPATDCTSGCTIQVDHAYSEAWYQILYLDSSNQVLATSDPQKIARTTVL